MSSTIVEALSSLREQFVPGSGEEERILPLDGRNKTRLINMRVRRNRVRASRGGTCGNFLTILHSEGSPLTRYRESNQRAVGHWFLRTGMVVREDQRDMRQSDIKTPLADLIGTGTMAWAGLHEEKLVTEFEREWRAPWEHELIEYWESRGKWIARGYRDDRFAVPLLESKGTELVVYGTGQ